MDDVRGVWLCFVYPRFHICFGWSLLSVRAWVNKRSLNGLIFVRNITDIMSKLKGIKVRFGLRVFLRDRISNDDIRRRT